MTMRHAVRGVRGKRWLGILEYENLPECMHASLALQYGFKISACLAGASYH